MGTSGLREWRGLGEAEAAARLAKDGPNELPADRRRSVFRLAFDVLREPMLLLLLGAGAIYLVLGDRDEALTLSSFVLVIIGIQLYQQRKTEGALAALRDLSSPRALVIRDGATRRIPGREVVRGDLVVLVEGDRIAADGVLREGGTVEVDESLLSGESVPVRKRPLLEGRAESARPGGDDQPMVYSGTLLVRGRGVAEITETGLATEMGKIGRVLGQVEVERTPLQKEVGRLVKWVALVGLGLCLILFVGYGLTRGDWLHGLLAGIALAMAVLPEEFPVVLTIFFALGAWRIAKSRVLTRRVAAIETLGAATVLCTDKTGTLTENRMRVVRLWSPEGACTAVGGALPEAVHEVVEFGILASQRDPFDPMEIACRELGENTLAETEHLHATWEPLREYPLSPSLLSMSHVYRSPATGRYVIAAKGAPEAIFGLCHLDAAILEARLDVVRAMGRDGLRVIAVARADFDPVPEGALPDDQHDFSFVLVGLIGLADPVRGDVPAAVRDCVTAGVRVILITGDSPETARAIAGQAGLPDPDAVITGPELETLDDPQLAARLRHTSVFARAVPEQKLRLVRALQQDGEVVAMTGDGVNDAPALRAAHIGVAMGSRGTDVAREAAALVVTNDDFTAIVAAVRLGRRIFDNLRKAMAYILAVHVPIAGMSLIPVLLGWPLALLPIHVVFLELIIDPACSVAFEAEPEEPGIMTRPPRRPDGRLFDRRLLLVSLIQGLTILGATLGIYARLLPLGELEARAGAFVALIGGNLTLILINRSWRRSAIASLGHRNLALWLVLGLGALVLILTLWVPSVRSLFRFAALPLVEIALAAGAGVACLGWFEAVKLLAPSWLHGRPR